MRVLLVDNYDSFTFNLVHLIEPLVDELVVWRNDEIIFEDVASFDKIIFSPGPSLPSQAGDLMKLIKQFYQTIPMFGVCLGMQAILESFGGELENLEPVRHGMVQKIKVVQKQIFEGMATNQEVGLYHSWGVTSKLLPDCFNNLATDIDDVVMACSHKKWRIAGVQFHPESIMTPNGDEIINNWIKE
ncbi:MAG: anthranilate synthase component II [Salibacteraceae bacterium]